MSVEKRTSIDMSAQSALQFQKLFYNHLDKKRHLLSNLYLDTAQLIWNGNGYQGKDNIRKFYESLPASETDIRSVDAQPIPDECVAGQTAILVSVSGMMKFSGRATALFSESIMLTTQTNESGNVWKIASDNFRFHETLLA